MCFSFLKTDGDDSDVQNWRNERKRLQIRYNINKTFKRRGRRAKKWRKKWKKHNHRLLLLLPFLMSQKTVDSNGKKQSMSATLYLLFWRQLKRQQKTEQSVNDTDMKIFFIFFLSFAPSLTDAPTWPHQFCRLMSFFVINFGVFLISGRQQQLRFQKGWNREKLFFFYSFIFYCDIMHKILYYTTRWNFPISSN